MNYTEYKNVRKLNQRIGPVTPIITLYIEANGRAGRRKRETIEKQRKEVAGEGSHGRKGLETGGEIFFFLYFHFYPFSTSALVIRDTYRDTYLQ